MTPKKQLYYPEGYKKLITDPAVLQSGFDDFVDKTQESYKTLPLVKFSSPSPRVGRNYFGSGFILDILKDKIIIATAEHVINHTSISVTKDIYLEKKIIGSHNLEIDKILKSPLGESDLAFVICKKPFGFTHARAKISNNIISPRLIGGFLEDKNNEYSFHTGYMADIHKNLAHIEKYSSTQFIKQSVSLEKINMKKELYYEIDMKSQSGMSGGPIISEYGVEGILVGSDKIGNATILPAASIVSHYETKIKPTLE